MIKMADHSDIILKGELGTKRKILNIPVFYWDLSILLTSVSSGSTKVLLVLQ